MQHDLAHVEQLTYISILTDARLNRSQHPNPNHQAPYCKNKMLDFFSKYQIPFQQKENVCTVANDFVVHGITVDYCSESK